MSGCAQPSLLVSQPAGMAHGPKPLGAAKPSNRVKTLSWELTETHTGSDKSERVRAGRGSAHRSTSICASSPIGTAGWLKVVQDGALRTSSQSEQWLGWWMAENLPALSIKARYDDTLRDNVAVARLNSILKTWVKDRVLKIVRERDEARKQRDFYAVGDLVGTPSTQTEPDLADDE
jgi:hypothetical protein